MERFVQAITGGGILVVGGLWLTSLSDRGLGWSLGWGLVVVGIAALAWGVGQTIDV